MIYTQVQAGGTTGRKTCYKSGSIAFTLLLSMQHQGKQP